MLPEVKLRDVSRDDIDHVAWWLEDKELTSRWFGQFGCEDPVHRGYDPQHMLEASQWEWERVFGDPHRHIMSVYDDSDEHIGESQIILDGEGGAELSLLIGRKELWHRGYGTATVLALLDIVFDEFRVDRAWVSVPEDNLPALGLFQKLGFVREDSGELGRRSNDSTFVYSVLTIDAASYHRRRPTKAWEQVPAPVVTITGLPGSGSVALAEEVARMLGNRFVDSEITERLCKRLMCTLAELEAFESSYRSFWTRLLNAIIVPMEWSATYDIGYHGFVPEHIADYNLLFEEQITKKQYLERLSRVVRGLATEGGVVLHCHASHLFIPPGVPALNVFVSASDRFRQQRIASEQGLSIKEAERFIKKTDRETRSIFKNLFGADLTDMRLFDVVVNMERMSARVAAEVVVGAMGTAVRRIELIDDTHFREVVSAE